LLDPKINIPVHHRHSAQPEPSISGDANTNIVDSIVQTRAYEIFELRGKMDGRAEQDWYQAEAGLKASGKQD